MKKHTAIRKLSQRGGFILFILMIACLYISLPTSSQESAPDQNFEDGNYVIGPHDELNITIWHHGDLNRQVPVSADGYFSFPLLGRIKASGLTVLELEKKVAELLNKDYIVDPQVIIRVTAFKSKKVFVLGEVARPGAYSLSKTDTVLEIITKAGGVTNNAAQEIIIVRPPQERASSEQPANLDSKDNQLIRVNLQVLLAGDLHKNITVQSNDTIYVPRADIFSIFGEISRPGTYTLNKETTIIEAITLAGGPTANADQERVELLRKEGNDQKKIILNMNEFLQEKEQTEEFLIHDGDVLHLPAAKFFILMGEVNSAGRHRFKEGLTVTQAIMTNGGFTDKASKGKVKILRYDEDGKQIERRADPNEFVQPRDILMVPQRFF
jgi:polysaccharide export outer membrane protein